MTGALEFLALALQIASILVIDFMFIHIDPLWIKLCSKHLTKNHQNKKTQIGTLFVFLDIELNLENLKQNSDG